MLVNNSYRPALLYTISTIAALAVISLILLGRKLRAAPTILDLWLTVVLSSWLYDVGLSSLFNNGRWDLGFYVGRVYGLVSAGFVLVMLIIETTRLNERLSVATTQLKENNDTLEARVQERTEELADIMKQLSQAQKMEAIGNLTGGIAHDFNNMLAIIIGSLDVIRETAYDKETDQLLQDVLSAALRGSDMTKRLLAFAKKQPLKPQITVINVLIYSLIDLLDRTLGSRITITLNLGEDIWPVLVDPPLLEAALTNLVTNARDAMPNGGHITIATSNQYIVHQIDMVTGEYAMIEFSDTGTGMPPEVVEHIFEPFYTTKEPGKGTGLGLSMVFGFMKQSGGHISVTSELGVGTTFRLYLPRAG
jgi:signal transduction histidine kinase